MAHNVGAIILGLFLALIGAVLAAGGVYLVILGGSAYYVLTGAGLLAAGFFLARGKVIGAAAYAIVYGLTVVWAFFEADGNAWALVPRLVGPTALMILVLLVLPSLKGSPLGWKASFASIFTLLLASFGTAMMYGGAERQATVLTSLPVASPADADPSPLTAAQDWPAYGGSYAARRASPLVQITRENVGSLQRAWVYETGDMPQGDPADSRYGAETTPLKVGDSLFLCTATNILIALDPGTGAEKWRFDPGVDKKFIPYTAACRGVAYYEVPAASDGSSTATTCPRRIIEGTLDGRLIAVDADTGLPCPGFGVNGAADIKTGMGEIDPGMVSMTSPPTIIKGVIVTGHQVKDGVSIDAPSGVLQGFDAVTGEHLWAWDMADPDGTARASGAGFTRGTPNMWTTASGDEELGLVYMPMGNSAGDYLSADRSAQENEYSTALVALDVRTGKPVWSFQTVDRDVWDYDLGSQATLVDFPSVNGPIPALILTSKQGEIYVLDRRTGVPLTDVIDRPAPKGGVEPEQRALTQRFSGFHSLAKPELTESDMWGMTPIDQMICRIQFRQAEYQGIYTPPTANRRWIQYPGYNGGSDWGGIAVDTSRDIIVANYNDMPNYNRLVPRVQADRKLAGQDVANSHASLAPQEGAPYAIDVNAGWRLPFTGLLCKEPPYGGIRAIDLKTGATLWDRPFGTARRNGPFGIPSGLPFEIGTPNNGGPIITASGLIFIAASTDNLIRAIDLQTGETLWTDTLSAGGQATPMTYEHEGRQYVVIMAGGHHFMETPIGDDLIAYALPDVPETQ